MATQFNKDAWSIERFQGDVNGRSSPWSSGGVIVDNNSKGERTAKDYVQARSERIKSWWDSKGTGGGNKES